MGTDNIYQLESLYRSTAVVNNICVYASPEHTKPIAIIEPSAPALRQIAERIGEGKTASEDLVKNAKVKEAIKKDMLAVGKQNGLQSIELIHDIVLSGEEWTPQSGLLTNAQKLNRKAVVDRYQAEIDRVYREA